MPALTPERQAAICKVAGLTRHFGAGSPEVAQARAELAAATFAQKVAQLAAIAPPLTAAQRAELRALIDTLPKK